MLHHGCETETKTKTIVASSTFAPEVSDTVYVTDWQKFFKNFLGTSF